MDYVLSSSAKISFIALHLQNLGKGVTVVTYSKPVKEYCTNAGMRFISFEPVTPGFRLAINPVLLIRNVVLAIRGVMVLKKQMDKLVAEINLGEEDNLHLQELNQLH